MQWETRTKKTKKNIGGRLPLRIEMTYTEIFVPKENIFILCNYIRMQESFGEPPATLTSFNYYFDKYELHELQETDHFV